MPISNSESPRPFFILFLILAILAVAVLAVGHTAVAVAVAVVAALDTLTHVEAGEKEKKKKAEINRCVPGGVKTLQALGQLLSIDAKPYEVEVEAKTRPLQLASAICISSSVIQRKSSSCNSRDASGSR